VIREWTAVNPSANTFSGTVREILRIEQPYPDHNIGQLAFNPNAKSGDRDYGMLYIAVADGGSDGFPVRNTDPLDNGQDLGTPLGKILRIDPLGIIAPMVNMASLLTILLWVIAKRDATASLVILIRWVKSGRMDYAILIVSAGILGAIARC
jgi:hypothetical protein